MSHKVRRQRNSFECGHSGFGTFCHFCKDKEAGKPVGIKKKKKGEEGPAEKRVWKRGRCPFCNSNRVKKNQLNVMSALDAKEFTCKDFKCGKEFNEDQVKEWDEVEVSGR